MRKDKNSYDMFENTTWRKQQQLIEEQTIVNTMAKEKGQNDKHRIYKTLHRKLKIGQHEPH